MSGLSLRVGGWGFSSATRKVVIRSFRPTSSSPKLSRFPWSVFAVLWSWKRGLSMEIQWPHMWNPRVALERYVHHVLGCCMSVGESTNIIANARRANRLSRETTAIRQIHDDVILLLPPEFFSLLFSCGNYGYFSLILSRVEKFK